MKVMKKILLGTFLVIVNTVNVLLLMSVINPNFAFKYDGTDFNDQRLSSETITKGDLSRYKIDIDTDYFDVVKLERKIIKVYRNNTNIGNAEIIPFRARLKESGSKIFKDTLIVRVEMQPIKDIYISKNQYWHGMNDDAGIKFQLNTEQVNVAHAPTSNPPESTETWSFSIGAETDKGVNLSIGFSSTTFKSALLLKNNYNSNNKTYNIMYDYKSSQKLWGNKPTNQWLTNNHYAFYAINFDTPANKDYDRFSVDYEIKFRTAKTKKTGYDGGYLDFHAVELQPTIKTYEHYIWFL